MWIYSFEYQCFKHLKTSFKKLKKRLRNMVIKALIFCPSSLSTLEDVAVSVCNLPHNVSKRISHNLEFNMSFFTFFFLGGGGGAIFLSLFSLSLHPFAPTEKTRMSVVLGSTAGKLLRFPGIRLEHRLAVCAGPWSSTFHAGPLSAWNTEARSLGGHRQQALYGD